jgi:hypothetical protein
MSVSYGGDSITFADGSVQSGGWTGFKNKFINGAMTIDQRNAGASFTNSNQNILGLDRWRNYGLTSAVLTIQQSTVAPAGFANSQSVTVTTSTTANDSGGIAQRIEAHNVYDLAWGTSSGASVTASFWVRGSVTGTYNVWISYNGPTPYYYVGTYTINASNTWEYKTVTIPAPPTAAGVFAAALNTQYMEFRFCITSSGGPAVSANTWSTTSTPKSAGTVDLASNSGATWYVTGVQLEKSTTASSFEYRSYGTELALCQRYFQKVTNIYVPDSASLPTNWYFKVSMRATPTITGSGAGFATFALNSDSVASRQTSAAGGTLTADIEL